MARRVDLDAVEANRKAMEDSTIDSPYVPSLGDMETDIATQLYGQHSLPVDQVGFMPSNEKNRSSRK